MASLALLIKPVSGECNLKCTYCFYRGHIHGQYSAMRESTLEILVKKVMDYCDERCTILFQGGEPTLCGLQFYEKFIKLVGKYNIHHTKVDYSLQTNGQLLDNQWTKFFAQNKFLVGVSIDGTKQAHDEYRKRPDGQSSFDYAVSGLKCLQQANVEYSILTTVTDVLKGRAESVYETCKQYGWNNLHIIPCMPDSGMAQALSADVYAEFINTLFDLWFEGLCDGQYVGIRLFENYVKLLSGGGYEQCGLLGTCAPSLVVERNGECYPCDFYVGDDMMLGSIETDSIETLLTESSKLFLSPVSSMPIDESCKSCQYYRICGGGCRRYRDSNGRYILCTAMKSFFAHCFSRIAAIAQNERELCTKEM